MARNVEDFSNLSKWMASATDFFVIRRFNKLNARVILKLQTEICDLETRLSFLDSQFKPITFLDDTCEERKEHLETLQRKLYYYNQFITTYAPIQARTGANARQLKNIGEWVKRYSAISPPETNFVNESDQELIAINENKSTPFRAMIAKIAEIHTKAHERHMEKGVRAHIYPDSFFRPLENGMLAIGGIAMLVAPLWWLLYTQNPAAQLGIITGFMVAVAIFISAITNATPTELLGAVAAYAALLLVFQIHNN